MSTLRVLFALCAHFDLELDQMDVVTAMVIWMRSCICCSLGPEGFVIPRKEHLVCKLKHSLYGLKQAPRQWYKKFDTFMLNHGFKRSHADHCLYTKKAPDGSLIVLVLYVDDMLIAGKHKETLNALKKELNSAFSMKDLGAIEP
ncbi:hypothetical protein L7F22_033125 [Adiantum nelumboides]|nr:hypothetical protein [Adiantum nelumboides]